MAMPTFLRNAQSEDCLGRPSVATSADSNVKHDRCFIRDLVLVKSGQCPAIQSQHGFTSTTGP